MESDMGGRVAPFRQLTLGPGGDKMGEKKPAEVRGKARKKQRSYWVIFYKKCCIIRINMGTFAEFQRKVSI